MNKQNHFTQLLFLLIGTILFGTYLYSGNEQGGHPPALQTSMETFSMLKSGAENGDYIRLTSPGYDPVLLRPDLRSIKERSLSAQSLSTNDSTIFYAATPVQNLQTTLSLNLMRNMMATAGTLPIIPSEDLVIKPQIELVKPIEANGENLNSAGQ